MDIQRQGIGYGITSSDETPNDRDHEEIEPSSYGLLQTQRDNDRIRQEIKAEFLNGEARRFHKNMTAAYKKTARQEARLDLEEDNRQQLMSLKMKLKAEMLGKQNELMESYRQQLRLKEAEIKKLEARLGASESNKMIRELEIYLASAMVEIDGLRGRAV